MLAAGLGDKSKSVDVAQHDVRNFIAVDEKRWPKINN
jgi:hypothetical protein